MKKMMIFSVILTAALSLGLLSCGSGAEAENSNNAAAGQEQNPGGGQASVKDDASANDIVKVAVGSKDHTTLVAAVKAADLVNVLANAGPFTVFAPVNAAFDALPKGTVEDLLKAENKGKLSDILQYHVALGVYKEEMFSDGQILGTASSGSLTMHKKGDKWMVNDANIVAAVPASNGIVYVIDKVLLPASK
ncbi:MAG: fasciclin domain-containing protein [Bacteroidetes bacterium]|nr:fasciclin domain-containing protein [Bacteroidota bacterium]